MVQRVLAKPIPWVQIIVKMMLLTQLRVLFLEDFLKYFVSCSLNRTKKDFSVKVSFIEIYNDKVFDLLNLTDGKQEAIDDKFKGISVNEVLVHSLEEAFSYMSKGSKTRHTSATAKNAKSSRSHAIFTVCVQQTEKDTCVSKSAKFQLVDLAGSERLNTSKVKGAQVKETININKGLLALGMVINALSEGKPHINYRDSPLTRLLQDSLGGNSYTVMIACVNPSSTSADETINTLRYAHGARNVKNSPVINIDTPAVQIDRLKKQVDVLKAALEKKNSSNQSSSDSPLVYSKIRDLNERLLELEEGHCTMNETIQRLYENITLIVTELMIELPSNPKLEDVIEKLKLVQAECLQLVANRIVVSSDVECIATESIREAFTPPTETKILSECNSEDEQLTEDNVVDQKSSVQKLGNIQEKLSVKESLASEVMAFIDYFGTKSEKENEHDLTKKIQALIKEKSDLQETVKENEKYSQEMQDKVDIYERQIKELQSQLRNNAKCIKMKKEVEDKANVKLVAMKKDIEKLKQRKAEVIRDMKVQSNWHAKLNRKKDQDIAKLEQAGRKKDIELTKMQTKFLNQVKVLQTKVKQADELKSKFQALQKKKPEKLGMKSKLSQEELKELVDSGVKNSVDYGILKHGLTSLEFDSDLIRDHIKELEEDSISDQEKVDKYKGELQTGLVLIERLREQLKKEEADQTSKLCSTLEGLTELSEAKSMIEYLYKKYIATSAENAVEIESNNYNLNLQQAYTQVLEEKLKSALNKNQDEVDNLVAKQEETILGMNMNYEFKMLDYVKELSDVNRNSVTEKTDPVIAQRVEMQDEEIKNLQSLRIRYEEKCKENDRLEEEINQLKCGKKKKFLSDIKRSSSPDICDYSTAPSSIEEEEETLEEAAEEEEETVEEAEEDNKSMMSEYLSEESFSCDKNDPDWRLTPLHKQLKRSRVEIKKPCECFGDCKTMRCRCRKSRLTCDDTCSCSKEKCSNKINSPSKDGR